MDSIPKTVPNLDLFDTSDRSTECDSPSPEYSGKRKPNLQFEKMRANLIGSLVLREKSSSVCHARAGSTRNASPQGEWDQKSTENVPLAGQKPKHKTCRSNSNLESFRMQIKGSLFSGFSSPKKSNTQDLSICSLEELKIAENPTETLKENVLDDDCLGINDQNVIKPAIELLTVEDESLTKKIREIEASIVDENDEDSESSYDMIIDTGVRQPIFFTDMDRELENLKEDLQVEGDPNIHFIRGNFGDYYQEEEILGEGTSGIVKRCVKKDSEEGFAVKIVQYRNDLEILVLIVKEFKNHSRLNHKNIIKVYELHIDYFNRRIYTVMELADCLEMFEAIRNLGHYSEAIASGIFKQILAGINYLHSNGVCHRDLKPHNILVSNDGKTVKITDFNVSKFAENKQRKYSSLSVANYKMWTHTGTVAFTAPEVLDGLEYTEAIDMWSAGTVLYMMLCGYQPFQGEYVQDLVDAIKESKYEFHEDSWSTISVEAKNLIQRCLEVDPKKRCLPSEALMHPWIANQGKASDALISMKTGNIELIETRPRGESSNVKAKTQFVSGSLSGSFKKRDSKRRSSENNSATLCSFQATNQLNKEQKTKKLPKMLITTDQELPELFEEDMSPENKCRKQSEKNDFLVEVINNESEITIGK